MTKTRKNQGNKVEDVVRRLRQQIASHELPPGSKLLEQDLATLFNVSRAHIREAIGALQQRGLVTRIPNRGAVVDRLDLARILEVYTVYEMLDGLAVRLATENTRPEAWQDLVEYWDGPMASFVRDGDFEAYVAGLEAFQARYLEAADSATLREMIDTIRDKVSVIIRRVIILPGRAEKGLEENRLIIAAMRRHDAGEAERLKRENIRSAMAWLDQYQKFIL